MIKLLRTLLLFFGYEKKFMHIGEQHSCKAVLCYSRVLFGHSRTFRKWYKEKLVVWKLRHLGRVITNEKQKDKHCGAIERKN